MGCSASIGCDLAGRRIFSEKIENICRFDEGFNLVPKAGYSGPGWWCSIESEEFFVVNAVFKSLNAYYCLLPQHYRTSFLRSLFSGVAILEKLYMNYL